MIHGKNHFCDGITGGLFLRLWIISASWLKIKRKRILTGFACHVLLSPTVYDHKPVPNYKLSAEKQGAEPALRLRLFICNAIMRSAVAKVCRGGLQRRLTFHEHQMRSASQSEGRVSTVGIEIPPKH